MKKQEFVSDKGIGYDILKKYILGEDTWTFVIWREIVRFLGKICVFSLYACLIAFLYSYYFDTCKLYFIVYRETWSTVAMILSGLILSFNVVFNYTFATFLSPGNTEEFKSYANQDYEDLKNRLAVERLNFCKKCESFKPEKTHHCSICKQCIIRKDHHNAWINNCVGYQNHRYLLLFLFYFQFMIIVNLGFSIPIIFDEALKPERTAIYPYVIISSIVFFKIAFVLSIWQFFLFFKGETTYEFLRRKLDKYEDQKHHKKIPFKEIIFTLFGTKWCFLIFLPSIRKLPFDGIKWDPEEEVVVQYLTLPPAQDNSGDSSLGVMTE